MERVLAIDERHLVRLAEPGHRAGPPPRGNRAVQQRLDDEGERLGRAEAVELFAPEGEVGWPPRPRRRQLRQRLGDVLGRLASPRRRARVDVADAWSSRTRSHQSARRRISSARSLSGLNVPRRGPFAEQSAVEVEDLIDDVDQIVDAVDRGRCLRGPGSAGYWPPKPRMFHGSTRAPQSMPRLSRSSMAPRMLGGLVESALVDEHIAGGEQDLHLGEHAHRRDGDSARLPASSPPRSRSRRRAGRDAVAAVAARVAPARYWLSAWRTPPNGCLSSFASSLQPLAMRAGDVGQKLRRRTLRDTWRCAAPASRATRSNHACCGLEPLTPDAIRIVPARTAADSHSISSASAPSPGIGEPLPEPVEQELPDDEAAIACLVVEMMRVPFAEAVVGPFVGGMVEVVAARIEGQFVEQGRVEVRIGAIASGIVFENLERTFDESLILALRDADAADEQRDRPHPFVVVDLAACGLLRARRPDDGRRSR